MREKQSDILHIFVRPSEHQVWREAALKLDKTKTQWIRDVLNEAAKKLGAGPLVAPNPFPEAILPTTQILQDGRIVPLTTAINFDAVKVPVTGGNPYLNAILPVGAAPMISDDEIARMAREFAEEVGD